MTHGPGEGADRPPEGLLDEDWGPGPHRHGPGRPRPPVVAALTDVATRSEALEQLLAESGVTRSQRAR
jgi:hypothetical protein